MITHLVHAVERVRASFRKLFYVPGNKENKENNEEHIWFLVFFFFFWKNIKNTENTKFR